MIAIEVAGSMAYEALLFDMDVVITDTKHAIPILFLAADVVLAVTAVRQWP